MALVMGACERRGLTGVAPCLSHEVSIRRATIGPPGIDLLLVVDNTQGMEAAQAAFAAQMPRLVEMLHSGTLPNGRRVPAPSGVRIGVITSDMGASGFGSERCGGVGDDALLQLDAACGSEDPPFLELRYEPDVSAEFGARLVCAANVGTGGCEFEQLFEAMLMAVTPPENGRARGQAGLNEFLRRDSLAGVILLTSADDCSAADGDLFNPEGPYADTPPSLRCYEQDGGLHALERFVDGLAAVHYLDTLVFGVIAGVPPDLITDPIAPDYGALIGPEQDPRMRAEPNPSQPTEVRPSCGVLAGGGSDNGAAPPLRLVQLMKRLQEAGSPVALGSICAPDFGPFVDAFAEQLILLNRECLPRPLERDLNGRVRCDVVEALPLEGEFTRCADRRRDGRVFLGLDDYDGREVCHVCQSSPEGALIDDHPECQALAAEGVENVGWVYREGEIRGCPANRGQVIEFETEPSQGAFVRLECSRHYDETPALGQRCSERAPCEQAIEGLRSVCDATSGTCQAPCERDADCELAGLTYRCVNLRDDGTRYCLNPTCQ